MSINRYSNYELVIINFIMMDAYLTLLKNAQRGSERSTNETCETDEQRKAAVESA